ncbi:hypothetical protein PHMEG_00018263 [Phytophthora megakarya]|uniref:Uncharacterized protein n=1 Tax=Phytophthora megakarya TaxID=4795 RepID=A0A225VX06_9STRA|nr:hypothetical protein PHMEG_00018263 [Phytophthora megakarya]
MEIAARKTNAELFQEVRRELLGPVEERLASVEGGYPGIDLRIGVHGHGPVAYEGTANEQTKSETKRQLYTP